MQFNPNRLYHIYNRGNRRIPIFYQQRNYQYFLSKIQKHICPYANVMAYCLMPNHFHLLVYTHNSFDQRLNEEIGVLLRTYTRAINIQEGQSGSLFQSGTKAKEVNEPLVCFNYIHLNPLRAKLVDDLIEWPFSSFPYYCGISEDFLVDHKVVQNFVDIDFDNYKTEIFQYLPYWDEYHGKI
ncbi:MAG: transposase [Cytophagia bacterium]|nr:transposase [Cytophagia bacterium]